MDLFCVAGDRRTNRSGNYNCELSGGGYGRNYAPAEPEWYTEGPVSQSDTIELHGFDGLRMRNASGGDASHDDNQLEEGRTRAQRRNKDDIVKNKESSSDRDQNEAYDTTSNAVSDDKRHQKNSRGN